MDTLCLKLWHLAEFSTTKDIIGGGEKSRLYSERTESQKWGGNETFTKPCIKQVGFISNVGLFLLILTSLKKVVGSGSFLNSKEHSVYSSTSGKIFMIYTVP